MSSIFVSVSYRGVYESFLYILLQFRHRCPQTLMAQLDSVNPHERKNSIDVSETKPAGTIDHAAGSLSGYSIQVYSYWRHLFFLANVASSSSIVDYMSSLIRRWMAESGPRGAPNPLSWLRFSGDASTSRQPGHFQITKVVRQVVKCSAVKESVISRSENPQAMSPDAFLTQNVDALF